MALQDVCGIRKTPGYLRWNSPALFSRSVGDTMPCFGEVAGGHLLQEDSSPLQLYVPSLNGKDVLSPSFLTVRPPFSLCHGTTTLGFVFQGGVIAAADSRASCSGLIACPAAQKIMPVHSHLVVTTSGSGADCMLWQRILARECRLYHLRHHRRLSVGGAAKLLAYMLHPFKGTELCVALTLCGWDGGCEGNSLHLEGLRVMEEEVANRGREEGRGSKGRRETRECAGRACDREGDGKDAGEGKTEMDEEQTASGQEASEADEMLGAKARRAEREREEDVTDGRGAEDAGPSRASLTESSRSKQERGRSGGTAAEREVRQEPRAGGPRLYYVCSDGTRLQGELFSVGSGSPYAYSVLDCGLRWRLSLSEAVSIAREAVYRATHRDAYSGNCVDVFYINSQGWRCREREDLREEYYREREKGKMRQGEQEECGLKDK